MKICVPTYEQGGLDDQVCPHFGPAPTFTVVDTETDDVNVIPNTSEHQGGRGYPPEIIRDSGAKVLLCGGLGGRAIQMLEGFGIRVFVGATGTVRQALDAFNNDRLQPASEENACQDHGGHGHSHEHGHGCGH